MRTLIIFLIGLLWLQPTTPPDEWTAWLRGKGAVFLIDSHGNEIQKVEMPSDADHYVRDIGISHDGKLIAYVLTDTYSQSIMQLRVYDTETQSIRLQYDLTLEGPGQFWNDSFLSSNNFSPDDSTFVIGDFNGQAYGWRILVFNLESGTLERTLTADKTLPFHPKIEGQIPIIFRFTGTMLTYGITSFGNFPSQPDKALRSSFDWDMTTDTLSENCAYTHIPYATFEPTGEAIVTGIEPDLDYIPDSDLTGNGQYTLEFYDSSKQIWQVFYQNPDFLAEGVTFIQNGERIILWGKPQSEKNGSLRRLVIIERDGSVVDQLEVIGVPHVQATNNGFIYTTYYDVTPWSNQVVYVNTRREHPFADQTIVMESKTDEQLTILWAKDNATLPLPDFVPWGNLMQYWSFSCPANNG